jgi:hypothetical protein
MLVTAEHAQAAFAASAIKKMKDHALSAALSNIYLRPLRKRPRICRTIFHVPRRPDFNAEIFIALARFASRISRAESS